MLRVGIAGLGFGATVLGPVLRDLSDVELVAIVGRDPERTAAVASALGGPAIVGSVDELFEHALDAVVLALPPDVNEEAVRAAVERGVAIFSEKPLARTAAVAASLRDSASHLTTAVDFEFAELATFVGLDRAIREGDVGRVRHVEVTWLTRSRAIEAGHWSWKTDASRGGGVLQLLGSHVVHLVELLFGRIDSVHAWGESTTTARFSPSGSSPALDTLTALLRLESGVAVTLVLGNAEPTVQVHEWRVAGEDGTLIARNDTLDPVLGFELTRHGAGDSTVLHVEAPPAVEADARADAARALARRFVAAARSGATTTPSFTEGARAAAVVEALERSAREGRTVQMGEIDGR